MVHHIVRALQRLAPWSFGAGLGLVAVVAGAPPLHAQAGAVTGTVVDSRSGRPIVEASVAVENSTTRTRTNVRGEFRLEGVSGTVRLAISRVGYKPQTVSATAGTPVRVALEELVVKLDELVVTGTAAEQTQRSLGNAIGKVAVTDIVQVAPPAKLQDMISVNVPGVRIFRSSGAVGTGGPTRIRGSGSLSLSNEPLIYVDGVRVNNDPAAGGDSKIFGYDSPSRANDLNPEEIESIEVLKGPSAATIYGTEASNGVIQIITKRGRAGRPTIDVRAAAGANWFHDPEGRYPANYYIGRDGQVHEFRVLDFQKEICQDPARNCPTHIFSTGTPLSLGASLSGGSEQLRYYFSLDGDRDEGYLHYNWQNKYNGRANLTYATTNDKFKIDVSLGAVRSRLRNAAFQPITSSILWACLFPGCEPDPANPDNTGWNGPGHGFTFYRPEDYDHAFGFDNVDRAMLSLRLSHRPTSWLRHQLTIGPDFTNNRTSTLIERDATGYNPFFEWSQGWKVGRLTRSTFLTVDYGAAADWNISPNLLSTTSAGAQYYYKQFDVLRAEGRRFSIPGESDITGAAQRFGEESFLENKNVGVYVQQQFALKNRLFLTAAARGDDNSAFGSNFDAVIYPKFSLSWVLSEEPFLSNSALFSQLKLRGAWGRAGLAPDVFSAIRTYQARVGPAGEGGLSPQNIGNPDLKPEVGEELELGFDAGLFNQRMGIEFTFYNKDIQDAIVSVPNRPSRGFPGVTFLNLGKTRNRGIELAIDGTPLSGENLSLDLRGTIATNSTKIVDMGGLNPIFTGGAYISQWNVEGFAPGSFFYRKVLGSTVQPMQVGPLTLPVGVDPICEGGTDLGDGDGTQVPCSEGPRIYRGRPTPSWNGSFSATLTIGKRLRILGLIDYLGGNTVSVGDVGALHTFFLGSRGIVDGSDPVLSGYLGTYLLQGDFFATGSTGLFKGGFAKLRTLSASYDLPASISGWVGASRGSITLSGENLAILWREQKESFGVGWVDPEVSSNTPSNIGGSNSGYIQESFPQPIRIRTTIRLTF